jgi:2-dehydro-3-deoxy-D-arabinonate dehydratase
MRSLPPITSYFLEQTIVQLVKYRDPQDLLGVGRLDGQHVVPLSLKNGQYRRLSDVLQEDDPAALAEFLSDSTAAPLPVERVTLLPPIDRQEVWAAGVTYLRSKTARMEESEAAASCYDRIYEADRPELFLKATPHRVVGPEQPVRIRRDATWNVPEPELALVLDPNLRIKGFTIGNDMSARDIEGDNPLYLPQAKVYDGCCALGPCITLVDGLPDVREAEIALCILRGGKPVFTGQTRVSQMARSFEDLISWLGRDNSFPDGVILLTGTGIVPDDDFTLAPGDRVEISIEGIGTLANPVVQG